MKHSTLLEISPIMKKKKKKPFYKFFKFLPFVKVSIDFSRFFYVTIYLVQFFWEAIFWGHFLDTAHTQPYLSTFDKLKK